MNIWLYRVSDGHFWGPGYSTSETAISAFGYSGFPPHKNDPLSEQLIGLGPIPRGSYTCGMPGAHPTLGPLAIPLSPNLPTLQYGRSGFYIHGDSKSHPGLASHGCVILPEPVREQIKEGDILIVWT